MELVTCRSCGAPNHPARPACGRCREHLPRAGAPVLAEHDGDAPSADAVESTAPSPDDPTEDPTGDPTEDATAAHHPVGVAPLAAAAQHVGDLDETAAHVPVGAGAPTVPSRPGGAGGSAGRALGDQATTPVDVVRKGRTVGAKVLDLLRGPDMSDTQPLDATAPARADVPARDPASIQRRSIMVVSVLGLGLGAVVGISAAARGLPFGGGEDVEGPIFDAGVYRREAGRLDVADVRATSYLAPTGTNSYEPELVLDDDLATAWNSDGAGRADGIGERFTVRLASPAWITALEFANGYQKDDVRFLANARISRARLDFDRGEQVNLVLIDQGGWQRVPLPEPILASSFSLEILESFAGDTYRDLGLSGLRVLGHPALGADREAATRDADA